MLKIFKMNYVRTFKNSSLKQLTKNFISTSTCCQKISTIPLTDTTDNQTSEPTVIVEKDTNITLIGLNREHIRNSIDAATAELLSQAINAYENDDTSPVAVLYGVGGSFSAGFDLKEVEQHVEQNKLDFLIKPEGFVGPTRRHFKKPIICGINGYCIANGLELALLCDFRVMEETAVMGFFNRHCGVPIVDGGTVRLPKIVGLSHAIDLITTGRRVTAREALKIGLINRLVATGTALGQAVHLAYSIAKFPGASFQHDRLNLYANTYNRKGIRVALQNETLLTSTKVLNEIKEGVERFKNSRKKGTHSYAYDIKPKEIPEWERVEIEIEERLAKEKAEKDLKAKESSNV